MTICCVPPHRGHAVFLVAKRFLYRLPPLTDSFGLPVTNAPSAQAHQKMHIDGPTMSSILPRTDTFCINVVSVPGQTFSLLLPLPHQSGAVIIITMVSRIWLVARGVFRGVMISEKGWPMPVSKASGSGYDQTHGMQRYAVLSRLANGLYDGSESHPAKERRLTHIPLPRAPLFPLTYSETVICS